MRRVLIFLPAVLWAQTPPTTSPAQPAQAKPAAAAATAPKPAASKAAPSAAKKAAPAPKPMTDDEKTIYALGLTMYRTLGQFDLSPAEVDVLKKALTDAAAGKPAEDIQTWGPKIQGFATSRAARAAEKQKTLN